MYEIVDPKRLPEKRRQQMALERDLRADGYSGKKRWLVCNDVYGGCQIYAKTMVDALWTAAKVWGVKPQSREFHQSCRVMEV